MKRKSSQNVWAGFTLAAMLVLSGAGCGDDKVVARGGGLPDGSADVNGADGNGPNPGGPDREIIVLHDVTTALQVPVTQTKELRVKVIDYAASAPAADFRVDFAILEANGGDGSLSTLQAYTDDAGIASVTFRSQTAADVAYTIQVSASGAEPVTFDVFVSDAPRGDLTVALQYEGPIAIRNVHLQLVPGNFTCGRFVPTTPPTDVIADKTLLGTSSEDAVFQNLPTEQRFTVVATAENQRGGLAAAGCLDGIVIIEGQPNQVTLTMYLLVLNPAGAYDSATVFDFTGAIPGQVGEIVGEINTLFTSPGTFLINQVKKLAALYVGELITDAVFGLFEGKVAEIIDDWMFNSSPEWVQDILIVGQDLLQVVNGLEMLADLQIAKLSSSYYIQGRLLWNGLVLRWRYGCPEEGEAGYDPSCGRYEFTLEAFQNTQFPMDIIEGKFTASVQDFDQLDIDNHTIKLNYGKLIIFVLNEMILPALTGEHTLLDAILSFVNCRSIAEGIGGWSALGIDVEDIESFCTDAITIIVSPVELILNALALDSQLRLSGHATLVDEDDDLNVDRIIDGSFLGHFESDGQQGSPFTGVWSATRKGPE